MIKFYLNRSKNKVSPIAAIYRYFGWSFKRSIGISINPYIWDKRYQKLKPIDGKAEKINSRIDDLRRKADDLAFRYKLHGIKPSMAEFQREMFGDMIKTDSIKLPMLLIMRLICRKYLMVSECG